jgi:hypothetical protein
MSALFSTIGNTEVLFESSLQDFEVNLFSTDPDILKKNKIPLWFMFSNESNL